MADWVLQCSPAVWDVFSCWEQRGVLGEDLGSWTVSRHLEELAAGDRFAFWIGGREAGVYAIGRLASGSYQVPRPAGGYWKRPPNGPTHAVDLTTRQFLFDAPIRKAELVADPDFADALVIRMPRTANPIKLTSTQWRAIESRVPHGRARTPGSGRARGTAVTERVLGTVVERTTVTPAQAARSRTYREAALVKRYEASLGRALMVLTRRLATGERLVCDAFDRGTGRLIEAKASGSRQDVRMAIGQLLDYQCHLNQGAKLTLLVPERPSADLVALLTRVRIEVVYEQRRGRFAKA